MQYGTQDVPHPSVINIPTTWRHLPRAVDPKLPGFSVESLRPYLHRPDRLGGDVDMGPSPVVFPATARRSKSCSSSICASANAPDGSRLGGRHAGPVGQPDQLLAVTGFPFPTPCPLSAAHWRRFRRYDTRSTRRRTATRARRWWAERCSTGGRLTARHCRTQLPALRVHARGGLRPALRDTADALVDASYGPRGTWTVISETETRWAFRPVISRNPRHYKRRRFLRSTLGAPLARPRRGHGVIRGPSPALRSRA